MEMYHLFFCECKVFLHKEQPHYHQWKPEKSTQVIHLLRPGVRNASFLLPDENAPPRQIFRIFTPHKILELYYGRIGIANKVHPRLLIQPETHRSEAFSCFKNLKRQSFTRGPGGGVCLLLIVPVN